MKVYKKSVNILKLKGIMMCGIALFIFFAQSVLFGVDCMKDDPRKMAWSYYDETDYNKVCCILMWMKK